MIEYNVTKIADTVDDAWMYWYGKLAGSKYKKSEFGEEVMKSRDGDVIGEIVNAITIINNPTKNIMTNNIRNLSMRYAIGELLWYLSGNNNLSEIQKYTKAWDRMSDNGITVNSNYGWCIESKYGFSQWEYVRELLKKHPETRQAVIHIKTANNKESKDVNCTVCLQFMIREGKLYLTTYMRSNDLWMGFPYDVFQFTCLQILMSMELGVELGTYTHIAGSLHLYKRDLKQL